MASDVRQQFGVSLAKKLDKLVPKAQAQAALRKAADTVPDAIRQMATKRTDYPAYSEAWSKRKKQILKSGKNGKRSLKKTKFAAKSVRDVGRLSGQTFEDLYVPKVTVSTSGTFFAGEFALDFKTARSKKVAAGNLKHGYDWFTVNPATPMGREIRKRFMEQLAKGLGGKPSGSFNRL